MYNNINIYTHPQFGSIRTVMDDKSNIWFVGKDVAMMLGYSTPLNAISDHVEKEDCIVLTYKAFAKTSKACLWSGNDFSNKILINESGLYSLVLSSKLPKAKEFKHWVTSEVLPSIRKFGGYMLTKQEDNDETIMARAILIAQTTIDRLKNENKQLNAKAEYLNNVIRCDQCLPVTTIAKELGLTAVELNKYLCDKKIQYKQSGRYNLYAEYARMNLAKYRTPEDVDEHGNVRLHQPYLVWTQEGRAFIHNLIRFNPPKKIEHQESLQLNFFN